MRNVDACVCVAMRAYVATTVTLVDQIFRPRTLFSLLHFFSFFQQFISFVRFTSSLTNSIALKNLVLSGGITRSLLYKHKHMIDYD